MGMYTEVQLSIRVKSSISDECLAALHWLVNGAPYESRPATLPEHAFFTTDSRFWCMHGASGYFVTGTPRLMVDDIPNYKRIIELDFHANIKNYNYEWENLLGWLSQFVDDAAGAFVGYYRYEEDTLPTLLFFDDDKIQKVSIDNCPNLQIFKSN